MDGLSHEQGRRGADVELTASFDEYLNGLDEPRPHELDGSVAVWVTSASGAFASPRGRWEAISGVPRVSRQARREAVLTEDRERFFGDWTRPLIFDLSATVLELDGDPR